MSLEEVDLMLGRINARRKAEAEAWDSDGESSTRKPKVSSQDDIIGLGLAVPGTVEIVNASRTRDSKKEVVGES